MFARQGIDGVEAFFELLQACWISVEVVKEAIQLAHGFFDLDLRAGQQVGGLAQGARGVADARQAVEADSQGVQDIA